MKLVKEIFRQAIAAILGIALGASLLWLILYWTVGAFTYANMAQGY
ncbi:MAG: hypothetical protein AAF889_04050 [Cyanobacteria bacterium P01_D01_bin.73]